MTLSHPRLNRNSPRKTSRNIGFVCDPWSSLIPDSDSSIALMKTAGRVGHRVHFIDADTLVVKNKRLHARSSILQNSSVNQEDAASDKTPLWHSPAHLALDTLDLVLMRVDPPVDGRYLQLVWLLEMLSERVPVLNPPQCLSGLNEKLSSLNFSHAAETLITGASDEILDFARRHQKIVIKPLNQMGGRNVYKFEHGDSNLPVTLENLYRQEKLVIAQKYLAAIQSKGDVRVFVIDGEPFDTVLVRKPRAGEHRGNLVTGASRQFRPIDAQETLISREVGAWLRELRVPFAGLDIIGKHLTEINITSPTGLVPMERAGKTDISGKILDTLLRYAYLS